MAPFPQAPRPAAAGASRRDDVNRDNGLFLTIGLLGGFIAGYIIHDTLAGMQPPRLPVGTGAAMGAAPVEDRGMAQGVGGATPAAAAGGGPMVAEVARLKEYVEKNPNDAEAVLQFANMNFDVQNWGGAKDLYERVITLKGPNPDVLTDLGVCYRELRDYPKALETFEKAKALDAKHWQSRYNAAIVLAFDLKDFDKADAEIAELRSLQPGNPDVQRLADEIARLRKTA